MVNGNRHRIPATRAMARNVFFILVGVTGLVLKRHYAGPYPEAVHSYGGNVAASFAVYYWSNLAFALLPCPPRFRKLLTAGLALAVVELFEALNGFGVMRNVYDRLDFAANAAGIALAVAVDTVTRGVGRPPWDPDGRTDSGMGGRPAV